MLGARALAVLILGSALQAGEIWRVPLNDQLRQIQLSSVPTEQKIQQLRDLLVDKPVMLLYCAENVAKGEGTKLGLAMFRDRATLRPVRLSIGHELMARLRTPGFADEYASFVIASALDGGTQEFMQNRDRVVRTAVGEIAFAAAGFEGIPREFFDKVSDPRFIPILTTCLDAPDDVYPEDQGDIVMGKPGDPTGRNVPRQLIPIALARLNAVQSVARMEQLTRTHHDIYLRANSIYAIARMGDPKSVDGIASALDKHPATPVAAMPIFEFGRGLIERGDERGIPCMSLQLLPASSKDDPLSVLYELERRLQVMEAIHSVATASFFAEVLEDKSVQALLLFDAARLSPSPLMATRMPAPTPQALLERSRTRIVAVSRSLTDQVLASDLKQLTPQFSRIAEVTKDDEIKTLFSNAAQKLQSK